MRNASKSRPDHSNVDWRRQVRNEESFRKFKFFKARFEFSEMTNCNFTAVSAKRACFIKANLTGSDFTGSNLEHANFSGANLTNVVFKSAILNGANFDGAITDGASFVHAAINGAKKLALTHEQEQERVAADAAIHRVGEIAKLAHDAGKQKIIDENMTEFLSAVSTLGLLEGTPEYKTFVSKFVSKKKAMSE